MFQQQEKIGVNGQYSHQEEVISRVLQGSSGRPKLEKAVNSEKTNFTDDAKVSQGSEGRTGYKELHVMIFGDKMTAEIQCK